MTFLHFFNAICYESLGHAAHNYSTNKLSFLNLAQQAFASAKSLLPLPYSSNENGSSDSPGILPATTKFAQRTGLGARQIVPSTPASESATPPPVCAIWTRPSTASSAYSQDDTQPSSDSSSNFRNCSLRQSPEDAERLSATNEFCLASGEDNQELRLSLTVLDTLERQSDLAPKPLSIKKPTTVDPSTSQRLLPPILSPNALGTTQQRTGLQVSPLVNDYESLSMCCGTHLPSTSVHASATSSLHLARYNAHLTSFRTQLSVHIASVSDAITKTTTLQKEHKANQSTRLASYWMLKPAAEDCGNVDCRAVEKKERIDRLRQNGWRVNKERFGWKGEEYYRELRRRAEVELRA